MVPPPRLLFESRQEALPVVGTARAIALSPQDYLGEMNSHEAQNAPAILYAAGKESLLWEGPRVSVIGSRAANESELERTKEIVLKLTAQDVTVVSGLAEGVDTAAHRAAMDSGGNTVAVLGTPLDRVYPRSNSNLQDEIAREHLLISQFAFGSAIQRRNFVLRNRTMALVSDATVIVAAGEGSGTQHQGWAAIRLGRPLYFLDSLVHSPAPWIQEQREYGAGILEATSIESFVEEIPGGNRLEPVAL